MISSRSELILFVDSSNEKVFDSEVCSNSMRLVDRIFLKNLPYLMRQSFPKFLSTRFQNDCQVKPCGFNF